MLADADATQRHSDLSPGRSSPEEQLDVQKALQIVSEHYGKRKAVFRLLTMPPCQAVQHRLKLPHMLRMSRFAQISRYPTMGILQSL